MPSDKPPSRAPDPFTRVTYHGKLMDNKTRVGLQVVERDLGYPLTIVQGCYSYAVGASAGTHGGGGVVDLAPYDHERKVRKLKARGWAAWYRPTIPGLWNGHVHAVMIDHGRLSGEARDQVAEYLGTPPGDGLKGDGVDPSPWRPDPPVVFDYWAALRDERLRRRITGLRARAHQLRDRASVLTARITYK